MVLKWSAKGTLAPLAAAWCFVACGDGVSLRWSMGSTT